MEDKTLPLIDADGTRIEMQNMVLLPSSTSSFPPRFKGFAVYVFLIYLRSDILRPVNRQQSGVTKGPALLLLLAVGIFAAGAVRYYLHGNFTLAQAGYCLIAILASLVVLLIFDYTLHHAKIVAVMVLVFVVLFLVASPAFCVGMGLGLAGMVVQQSTRT